MLSARLTIIGIAGYVAAVASVVGFAIWAMLAVDQRALSRELHFAEQAIAKILERVPQEQESITVWDDAVVRTKALDVTWMADNVGEWMHSYFGHTAVYVLNAANEPIYA